MKKTIGVALVVSLLSTTNSFAGSPLIELMQQKMAFDATCRDLTFIMANLPECQDCAAAKAASLKLKKATRALERINDYLTDGTPSPNGLDLTEKAAARVVYGSFGYNARTISLALENLTEYLWLEWDSDFLSALISSKIVVAAIAIPITHHRGDICNSVDNEIDCKAIGCTWWVPPPPFPGGPRCADPDSLP